jgi:virginiamycin A acetyltransferase
MSKRLTIGQTNSFNNFVLDAFVRSFECKDGLIEALGSISEEEKTNIVRQGMGDLQFWHKVFDDRASYLRRNVVLTVAGESCSVDEVSFDFRFGWIVHNGSTKAYLGKSSFFGGIKIEIGRRTYFSGHNILRGNSRLQVGSYCSIAEGLYINVDADFHPMSYAASINFDSEIRMKEDGFSLSLSLGDQYNRARKGVSIGNDVWIGKDVRIFHGTEIGDGCVIGERSLVKGKCESFGVYAGIPAKLLKKRFPEEVTKELLEVQWWNWSEEKMLRNAPFFDTDLTIYSGSIMDLIAE